MKKQQSTVIQYILSLLVILTVIYFGSSAYSLQNDKIDQLVLEVAFEGETVEGYTQMVQVPAETSVYLIDVIGPRSVEQANLVELLDSALTVPIPQYEQFTFVFVNGKLIQIYQGQSEILGG